MGTLRSGASFNCDPGFLAAQSQATVLSIHLVSTMLRSTALFALLCFPMIPACAQTPEPTLKERLFDGRIANIDTIGVRRFVEQTDSGRTDSAEVYFNVRGEPVAWRAWIGGDYFVFWEPYGRFSVSDSTLLALQVYQRERRLLEMLDGLELVEQAAKKPR